MASPFVTVQALIQLARAEIGTVESPAKSNKQKYGEAYGWNGVAWCVQFIWWLFYTLKLDYLLPKKTASCAVLIDAAKRAGLWVTKNYQPGDVIFYRFGKQNHVGYLVSVSSNGKTVTTIEGNTATGNDANGGRVMQRTRNISYVVGALRPRYETVEPKKHKALVAQECADGKGNWGTGTDRRAKLAAAGYDAAEVQRLVNGLSTKGIRTVVTASSVNLRRDPTTEKDNVKHSFPKGTALCIVEIKEGPGASAWGRVTHEWETGKIRTGWVSMDWVEV